MLRRWCQDAQGAEVVFLDPDNGVEVRSRPYGRKDSSKYVYWREVKALAKAGRSVLVYQHYPQSACTRRWRSG